MKRREFITLLGSAAETIVRQTASMRAEAIRTL
jgi:hypothetical protein